MTIWTYRRRFAIGGATYSAAIPVTLTGMRLAVAREGAQVAGDAIIFAVDGTRNLVARAATPEGAVEVEAGYVSIWTVGIAARRDGALVHESHPGRRIAWPEALAMPPATPESLAAGTDAASRWARNKPSFYTDIALAVVFFFVGSWFGLVAAAVGGAAAGLVLWGVQKAIKVDLLGGLAPFGIALSLISAAIAVLVEDPFVVQMRTTIVGGIGVAAFLADAVFAKGEWLGARVERYLPAGSDPRRISFGLAAIGAIMAGLNWAVAAAFSEQVWLFYTSFLDLPLAMALGVALVFLVKKRDAKAPA